MTEGIWVPAMGTDEELAAPQFDKAGRYHDWRNHVGERTKALWASFTADQRRAIALDADELASDEHWE